MFQCEYRSMSAGAPGGKKKSDPLEQALKLVVAGCSGSHL